VADAGNSSADRFLVKYLIECESNAYPVIAIGQKPLHKLLLSQTVFKSPITKTKSKGMFIYA